jgi:hypothetical protein
MWPGSRSSLVFSKNTDLWEVVAIVGSDGRLDLGEEERGRKRMGLMCGSSGISVRAREVVRLGPSEDEINKRVERW